MQTCSEPAGLGEVNDEELNRLDWELEKGFNEALQSEKDFMDGVRVGFLKNMTKLPFNLAGFVLNSREVQDMPDKLESSDVEDEGAYVGGKITADVVTTVLGIIGVVSGVGQVVTGLAGDVGGGALCASGVGIPAGVAVVAGSTTLVVAGAAEVAASASLVYSSVSNLGRDVDELKESKEKKETTSPEEGANEAETSGEANVDAEGSKVCDITRDVSGNSRELIGESDASKKWGVSGDGVNQGVKHFCDVWEKYPKRIMSLEKRLGVPEGTFSNSVEGFDNFTLQAERVIKEATLKGTLKNGANGQIFYYIEAINKPQKGVIVTVYDGKIQSMMTSRLSSFYNIT